LGLNLLTARQFVVLTYLADGYTDKELANLLGISAPTARHHVNAIIVRMGANNRTHAVALAYQRKLLKVDG